MDGYDLIDEVVVEATPEHVWTALIAEFRGAARWWVPHNTFVPLSGSTDQAGGEVRVTVHTRGVDRGGLKLRFTARTRTVDPARLLTVDYVDGVFRGESTFHLAPLEGGRRTRLGMHFRGEPHGWLRLLARVAPIDVEHSKSTRTAFGALSVLLAEEGAAAGGAR